MSAGFYGGWRLDLDVRAAGLPRDPDEQALWTRRSAIADAAALLLKSFPQSLKGRLVVTMVDERQSSSGSVQRLGRGALEISGAPGVGGRPRHLATRIHNETRSKL